MARLLDYLLLAVAGGAGTLLRVGCNTLAARLAGAGSAWAGIWATLAVNVLGSFAFGLIYAASQSRPLLPEPQRAIVLVGLLGGFTTYSTFAFQAAELAGNGRAAVAVGYVAATTLLAIGAAWAGLRLGAA